MNLKIIAKDIHSRLFKYRYIDLNKSLSLSTLTHEEKITLQSTLRHSWLFWCLIQKKLSKLSKKEFLEPHLCALMVIMENKLCKQKADYYLSSLWQDYLKKNKIIWVFKSTWSFLLSLDSDLNSYRDDILASNTPELHIARKILRQERSFPLGSLLSHPPLWCVIQKQDVELPVDAAHNKPVTLCTTPLIKSYRLKKTLNDKSFFNKGLISYQDIATQLSSQVFLAAKARLDVKTIIDTCASPGGKTLLLHKVWPKASIVATDLNEKKVSALNKNLDRVLGNDNAINCRVFNWEEDNWGSTDKVNLVLCDLPCTGSGVIRKHPDILWSKNKNHLDELKRSQRAILKKAADSLSPKGLLVIATCSILKEENEDLVQHTVQTMNFKEVSIKLTLGKKSTFGWTILPTADNDGAFYCLLQKT